MVEAAWVAVKELKISYYIRETLLFIIYIYDKKFSLSYYIGETLLFIIYTHYGNLI